MFFKKVVLKISEKSHENIRGGIRFKESCRPIFRSAIFRNASGRLLQKLIISKMKYLELLMGWNYFYDKILNMKNKLNFEPDDFSLIIHLLHSRGFKIRLKTKVTSQNSKLKAKIYVVIYLKPYPILKLHFYFKIIYIQTRCHRGGGREQGMALNTENIRFNIQMILFGH